MSIAQHTKPDSINQNEMDTSSTNPDIFPRLIIALVSCVAAVQFAPVSVSLLPMRHQAKARP